MKLTTKSPTSKAQPPKKWLLKALPLALMGTLGAGIYGVAHADDLEIYQGGSATASSVKPTLMIAISLPVTMGNDDKSYKADYNTNSCNGSRNNQIITTQKSVDFIKSDGNKDGVIKYDWRTCHDKPQRVSVLTESFIKFLANPHGHASLKGVSISEFNIGLSSTLGAAGGGGSFGYINYPARPMTDDNRKALLKEIAKLHANHASGSLNLLMSESTAYLLGKDTRDKNATTKTLYRPMGFYTRKGGFKACTEKSTKIADRVDKLECAPDRNKKNATAESLGWKANDPKYQTVSTNKVLTYYVEVIKVSTNPWAGAYEASHPGAKNGSGYISPLSASASCAGNGVYFLNDAEGYTGGDNTGLLRTEKLHNQMTKAITGFNDDPNIRNIKFPDNHGGGSTILYNKMAGFMKKMRDAKNVSINGKNVEPKLLVAVAGYGNTVFKSFANMQKQQKTYLNVITGETTTGLAYNCDSVTGSDVYSQAGRQMCKMAEKGYGYGEGGFYYIKPGDPDEQIAASFSEFATSLLSAEIKPVSTGTMAVPLDVLSTGNTHGSAYLPVLDPIPNQKTLWNGNLKKYNIKNATLYGADNKLVVDRAGFFNENTYDFWNKARRADEAKPQVGGAYDNLHSNPSGRNLYVNTGSKSLTKVAVTSGKAVGFTSVMNSLNKSTDKAEVSRGLARFLGYDINVTDPNKDTNTDDIKDGTSLPGNYNPDLKTLGGVLHSTPQLVTYTAPMVNGRVDETASGREDYVLYGSMDGALHMVDNKTGTEVMAFIPKEILDLQAPALSGGTTHLDSSKAKLPHGVDAPWNVYASYTTTNDKAEAKSVIASGGLRLGGSSYYGLDITEKEHPKLLYTVGSNYANLNAESTFTDYGAASLDGNQQAFSRMGMSWGKPSVGFVRSGGKTVAVDFLPGGYDMRYEQQDYFPKQDAQGNAVYMVQLGEKDERTNTINTSSSGKLLWWASQTKTNTGMNELTAATNRSSLLQQSHVQGLYHSVVTQVRVLDRNYDGLTDHIYFADLGGNVWRADINNSPDNTDFKVDRVVKVFDLGLKRGGTDKAPRIYERPLITFTREIDGNISALVTVGTGNRSNPVSNKRTNPDGIYTFIDRDVTRPDLFDYKKNDKVADADITLMTSNLDDRNLVEMQFSTDDRQIKTKMKSGEKQGWYLNFNSWVDNGTTIQNTNKTRGIKMFNEPDAQAGYLFVSTYNPNYNQTPDNACAASVIGTTQQTLMCLPFGNCAANLKNPNESMWSKRPTITAGAGIVDSIVTQSKGSTNGHLFGLLCTGADCNKQVFDGKNGNTPEINRVGLDLSKTFNPRNWWEK